MYDDIQLEKSPAGQILKRSSNAVRYVSKRLKPRWGDIDRRQQLNA